MKFICPVCGSHMRKQRESVRKDGVVSMQRRCSNLNCNKIKTFYPYADGPVERLSTIRVLSDEQVKEALTSDVPHASLARKFGCSPQAVRDVRYGRSYVGVFPDLPRRNRFTGPRRFCRDCIHRINDKCSMGFPEAKLNTYAQVCPVYEDRPRTHDFSSEMYQVKAQIERGTDELSAV